MHRSETIKSIKEHNQEEEEEKNDMILVRKKDEEEALGFSNGLFGDLLYIKGPSQRKERGSMNS